MPPTWLRLTQVVPGTEDRPCAVRASWIVAVFDAVEDMGGGTVLALDSAPALAVAESFADVCSRLDVPIAS